MKKYILGSALAALLSFASEGAHAETNKRFLFSPVGPGAGEGVFGIGGRLWLIIPSLDFHYVRGLTDSFDLSVRVNTLGIITLADVGARYRLLGSAASSASLSVGAGLTSLFVTGAFGNETAAGVAFAGTPGLTLAFGNERTQFSIGLDTPILFAGAGVVTGDGDTAAAAATGFTLMFRPHVAIEFSTSDRVNMYVQLEAVIVANDEDTNVLAPLVALGAAW